MRVPPPCEMSYVVASAGTDRVGVRRRSDRGQGDVPRDGRRGEQRFRGTRPGAPAATAVAHL